MMEESLPSESEAEWAEEESEDGEMEGALKESMLVVWRSSRGALMEEMSTRRELRWEAAREGMGGTAESCFARRKVMDLLKERDISAIDALFSGLNWLLVSLGRLRLALVDFCGEVLSEFLSPVMSNVLRENTVE
jgi:hypothetical protein